ncbi:uncharacterized protein LOC102677172 isoform X2 [Apis dorsata]|uniref:WW domain binding protein VOPP1 n=3 Tax=Apis TaxID=7459 RepID=A0A7M7MRI1_APIME|nr:uncharacterized protein LOC409764 isoform X2 [Apis mellifera]XP_006621491.1 uncharacterized protein LOC102677172 isoform X2 [Apis dorsata]XP_006621492.1 uncharacterized protein LOC102677172 isoform X2 [Apis dorsata]XP_006621493.1 uncharacterized protein LOC102677172 isoform X2 [Apis dorsata]XP_016770247.1 uncharacterized protein LOC409764 isoform X2 [Apis mellifera]XP_016906899.1 uncharacterized protein LOC107994449 isoform X2 [Apis cerana]XP_026299910.1 uncharacterized protein LOC409764 i|eukprot:XP_006570453.1 uncharacterized protein LOC409764 isoform X2 [Apis mellifera]
MFNFLIWTYWYLWAAVLVGLAIAAACGCWLWKRHHSFRHRSWSPEIVEDFTSSDRGSSVSWYSPPRYSRSGSFVQALPPPYNEVTAKPNLYPLVIGYDEGSGKGTSGFVMRYFRSLSHASTLDSLGSSFMCNMVNEANTIIPPPYSCNNSVDELSAVECARMENMDVGSVVSLANHRTTSDISSLAAQSPCSPPRATSPTIELRELLDKIQQLPQLPGGHSTVLSCYQNRPQVLCTSNANGSTQRPLSPGDIGSYKTRRTRGKMYMPLGLPSSKNKTRRWLSRSAPTTPSGTIPMSFLPGQTRRPSETDNNNRQVVPLLSEQDETESNNVDQMNNIPLLSEQEEDRQQT